MRLTRIALHTLLVLVLLGGALPVVASSNASAIAGLAITYLAGQIREDGGLDAFDAGTSDVDGTARAILGLAVAGQAPGSLANAQSGLTMVDFLLANAASFSHVSGTTGSENLFPGRAGVILAAAAAADLELSDLGGVDLVAELESTYQEASGTYATEAQEGWSSGAASEVNQAWAMIGLAAAGGSVPRGAADALLALQGDDGSWAGGDPDTTALAVVALVGSGHVAPDDSAVSLALDHFREVQQPSGGWRPSWDDDPVNADTTGWVVQALRAAGQSPLDDAWTREGTALDALTSLLQDDGRIGGTFGNAYSTAEALLGLGDGLVTFLGREARAARALEWVATQQNDDGSFDGFSGPDPGATADVVLAYAAAGQVPADLRPAPQGLSPVGYLVEQATDYALLSPANAGKLAVALSAAGLDPRDVAGADLIDLLFAAYDDAAGAFGGPEHEGDALVHAWAILGLAAAGEEVPAAAVQHLLSLQGSDGNWVDAWGFSGPDTTGMVMQALAAAGLARDAEPLGAAAAYLRGTQDADGGWENANSTAMAIQGLLALGEDLRGDEWRVGGRGPLEALRDYQKPSGPFVWSWEWPDDNGLATWQAVPALWEVHYPLGAASRSEPSSSPLVPTVTPPATVAPTSVPTPEQAPTSLSPTQAQPTVAPGVGAVTLEPEPGAGAPQTGLLVVIGLAVGLVAVLGFMRARRN